MLNWYRAPSFPRLAGVRSFNGRGPAPRHRSFPPLAPAIREARTDRARLAEMGRRGRAAVERSYTAEHAVAKWTAVVRDLEPA